MTGNVNDRPGGTRDQWLGSRSAGEGTSGAGIGISLLVLAVIGIGVFVLLTRSCEKPRHFVQFLYVKGYGEPDAVDYVPHSRFGYRDVERLRDLLADARITNCFDEQVVSNRVVEGLQDTLEDNFRQCDKNDVAIVCCSLSAFASADGDEWMPFIRSTDRDNSDIPLPVLLEIMESLQAGTKILLIDAGQQVNDLENGILVNEFPFRLHQLLDRKQKPMLEVSDNLWVIVSNGMFETSQISYARQGSVFSLALAQAIQQLCQQHTGENGDDDEVTIDEFYSTLCGICADMTTVEETDGQSRARQIPLLMRGGYGVILDEPNLAELDRQEHAADMQRALVFRASRIKPRDEDSGQQGESADSDQATAETDSSGTTQAEIMELISALPAVWNLRDELQSRRRLADGSRMPSPIDFAPHLWLQLNYELAGLAIQPQADIRWADVFRNGLQQLLSVLDPGAPPPEDAIPETELPAPLRRVAGQIDQLITLARQASPQTVGDDEIDRLLGEIRDRCFRSRYYVDWCLRELELGTSSQVDRVTGFLIDLTGSVSAFPLPSYQFKTRDRQELARQLAAIRQSEQGVLEAWDQLRSRSLAGNALWQEQVLLNLLASPAIGYPPAGASETAEGEASAATNPSINQSRDALQRQWIELRKRQPEMVDAGTRWARHLGTGNPTASLSLWQDFIALAEPADKFQQGLDAIPDLPGEMDDYLDGLRISGSQLRTALESVSRGDSWYHAIVDGTAFRRIVDTRDPTRFAWRETRQFIREATANRARFANSDRRSLNLDLPALQRELKFEFQKDQGDPAHVQIRIGLGEESLAERIGEYLSFRYLSVPPGGEETDGEWLELPVDASIRYPLYWDVRDRNQNPLRLRVDPKPGMPEELRSRQIDLTLQIDEDRPRLERIYISLQLPKPDDVRLLRVSEAGDAIPLISGNDAVARKGNRLAPYFNRFRAFNFQVSNLSGRDKKIGLELIAVSPQSRISGESRLPGRIVADAVRTTGELDRHLDYARTQSGPPFAVASLESLPAGRAAAVTWLPFTIASEGSSPGEPAGDTAGSVAAGPEAADGMIPASNGILCRMVIEDDPGKYADSGKAEQLYWLELEQYPLQSFVSAEASVISSAASDNPVTRKFRVTLRPNWPAGRSPLARLKETCECRITTDRPVNFITQQQELLDQEQDLEIDLTDEDLETPLLVYVQVNGYRGVYIYEVTQQMLSGRPGQQIAVDEIRAAGNYIRLAGIAADGPEDGTAPPAHQPLNYGNKWILKSQDNPQSRPNYKLALLIDIRDQYDEDCHLQIAIRRTGSDSAWQPVGAINRILDRRIAYQARLTERGELVIRQDVGDHAFVWTPPTSLLRGSYELRVSVLQGLPETAGAAGEIVLEPVEFEILFDDQPPQGTLALAGTRTEFDKGETLELTLTVEDDSRKSTAILFVDQNQNRELDDGEDLRTLDEAALSAAGPFRIPVDLQEFAEQLKPNPSNQGGREPYRLGAKLSDVFGHSSYTESVGIVVKDNDQIMKERRQLHRCELVVTVTAEINRKSVTPENIRLSAGKAGSEPPESTSLQPAGATVQRVSLPIGKYRISGTAGYQSQTTYYELADSFDVEVTLENHTIRKTMTLKPVQNDDSDN
jgi:hypothetical protein